MNMEDIKEQEQKEFENINQEYLFDLDFKKHEEKLKLGKMDEELIEAIREKGYPLDRNAKIVEIFMRDHEGDMKFWKVEGKDEYIFLKSNGDKLNVYICEETPLKDEQKSTSPRFGGHRSRRCDGNCEDCDLAYSFLC